MTLLFVLVAGLVGQSAGSFDYLSPRTIAFAQQQGPNTCVVEEVPGTLYQLWTECRYWPDRHICGQKATIRYDCCEGYFRINSEHGCTGVESLVDVVETARRSGATRFADLLETSGVAENLRRAGPGVAFTLFAPIDQVMDGPNGRFLQSEGASNPTLLYHIVERRYPTKRWQADQFIETRLSGASVRLNKFSSKIETVNCAMVIRKDREATNGVVHIIDDILNPDSAFSDSLLHVLQRDGRFRQLLQMLQRSTLMNQLQERGATYTLLAPNDEAFQKIPVSLRQRLLTNQAATEALLAHLVITQPVCRAAATAPHKLGTRGGELVDAECDTRGVRIQNNRLGEMILASNGIIYMLDDVPVPDAALSLLQLLGRMHLYTFLDLVRIAELENFFDDAAVQLTLFAPSELAMSSIPHAELTHLRSDASAARRFVLQHVTRGIYTTDSFTDNQVVRSAEGNSPLRLQVYRRGLGVETAMMEDQRDRRALNGIVHVVSAVIRPADRTLREQLQQDGNFTMFLRALDALQADEPGSFHLGRGVSGYSVLVPTDEAFKRLSYDTRNAMFDDRRMLRQVFLVYAMFCLSESETGRNMIRYTAEDSGVILTPLLLVSIKFTCFYQHKTAVGKTEEKLHRSRHQNHSRLISDENALSTKIAQEISLPMYAASCEKPIMQQHFLNKIMASKSMKEDLKYEVPSQTGKVRLQRRGDTITVDDATTTRCDQTTLDGVVHVINKVLWPENVTWGSSATYPPPLMAGRDSASSSSSSRRFTYREEFVH